MNKQEQQNNLRNECREVNRITILSSLIITTYKTYAVKDEEVYDYDWDYQNNRTIKTKRKPTFKKDDFVLLVKTYNGLNKVTDFDLYTLQNKHIVSYGRDINNVQRNVFVDKKWI